MSQWLVALQRAVENKQIYSISVALEFHGRKGGEISVKSLKILLRIGNNEKNIGKYYSKQRSVTDCYGQ